MEVSARLESLLADARAKLALAAALGLLLLWLFARTLLYLLLLVAALCYYYCGSNSSPDAEKKAADHASAAADDNEDGGWTQVGRRKRKRRHEAAQEGPSKKLRVEDRAVGRVKRLLSSRDPPFGFITPEDGGADLYFNERLLGGGKTWREFAAEVPRTRAGYVFYRVEEGASGRRQAAGVVLLEDDHCDDADENSDGHISAAELQRFLRENPELLAVSRTRQELELERREREWRDRVAANEAEAQLRDDLYKKQNAAEDALWDEHDRELEEAKKLRDRAQSLWESSERCWQSGQRDRCKDLQSESKALQAQAREHSERARQLKLDAKELDWKHNEEMFNYVMHNEHDGRLVDGSWIDLHGLSADFAVQETQKALEDAQQKRLPSLEIITGAGHHSGKRGPVIKRRVHALLKECKGSLISSWREENEGSLIANVVQPFD